MADEALASLMAITDAPEAVAKQVLEAAGGDVAAAVELYFASQAADADADAAYARQLAGGSPPRGGGGGGGFGGGGFGDDEDVRAPLPSFRETLAPSFAAGPPVSPGAFLPQGGDPAAMSAAAAAAAAAARAHLAAFRDFEAEGEDDDDGGAPGGRPRRARGGPDAGLAGLFAPPQKLLYLGSFEQAKAAATQLDRWLLVNVQSNGAFGSHQLNRDTWAHDTVAELVAGSFVFLQTYDEVEEGRKLLTFYQLLHRELPVTLLVDPITGACMHSWHGFVAPDRFLEDCVPFCDAPPSASAGPHKKHKPQARAPPAPTPQHAAGVFGGDDELAAAIAASLADARAGAAGGGEAPHPVHAAVAAAPVAAPEPPPAPAPVAPAFDEAAAASAAAALAAALPAEPAAADAAGCRMGLRLPDGERTLRRFPLTAPVAALRSWAISAAPPAAVGRPFRLAAPGAALPADEDATSIAAAGLAGAMLSMTWIE